MNSPIVFFAIFYILVCVVFAEDPITVSVGYRDGGFVGFQSKSYSPYYIATSGDAFVINDSPDDTSLELTLAAYGKNPRRVLRDTIVDTVAKDLDTKAIHESYLRVANVNATHLNIHDSDAPGTNVEEHEVVGGTLTLGGSDQWALFSLDDFNENGDGWFASTKDTPSAFSVAGKRQSCGVNGDKHLGGYCNFATVDVSKKYIDLPRHSTVRITARVHFFDKWFGEYAYAKVDGQSVWQQSHFFCAKPFSSMCRGIDTCGDSKYSDKMSQKVSITLPHTASELTVTFGADLGDKSPCVASWGVDDVMIELKH